MNDRVLEQFHARDRSMDCRNILSGRVTSRQDHRTAGGETGLFCHNAKQTIADLVLSMTDPGAGQCIPAALSERQLDLT
jgi:hypothetical protein